MSFQKYLIAIIALAFVCISACVPAFKKEINVVEYSVDQAEIQKLINFQDKQVADSIYPYFRHDDPAFRYLSALAFASYKEPEAIDSLATLLTDRIYMVRSAAAYALGQIGDAKAEKYLIESFKSKDTASVNSDFNASVLEAVGKCGSEAMLEAMSNIRTYRSSDTMLLLGQTRGIYRFALRDMVHPKGTDVMVKYATESKYPFETRLMAANYLYRAKNLDLDKYKFQLANTFNTEESPEIKMALAVALGKTKNVDILSVLLSELDSDGDYRVKCNIIRALGNFPYINCVEKVLEYLKYPNEKVAYMAADYLFNHGKAEDAIIYRRFTREDLPWRVKAHLFSAVNKHLPIYYTKTKTAIRGDLRRLIDNASTPYEKAAYLDALIWDPYTYRYIKETGFESEEAIVRTTAVSAIGKMLTHPDFDGIYRGGRRAVKSELVQYMQEAIGTGDGSIIAVASGILRNESLSLKDELTDISFLKEARDGLVLPRDIESYNEISRAIHYFEGSGDFEPVKLGHNHSIDWDILKNFADSNQVVIKTDKGEIQLKLYKQLSPGSVANFLELVSNDYYTDKGIHRVVPNFVIQGGCPNGDGYGSLDYSIRSELGPNYYDAPGYIGMASAGNHTECTQWFITHSPTPHLDGNYTIFGEVTDGMDVVHAIEVGDSIQNIRILEL